MYGYGSLTITTGELSIILANAHGSVAVQGFNISDVTIGRARSIAVIHFYADIADTWVTVLPRAWCCRRPVDCVAISIRSRSP